MGNSSSQPPQKLRRGAAGKKKGRGNMSPLGWRGRALLQGASGSGLAPTFYGLVKALRSALVSDVARYRTLRLLVFSFAFGVGFGPLAVAEFS